MIIKLKLEEIVKVNWMVEQLGLNPYCVAEGANCEDYLEVEVNNTVYSLTAPPKKVETFMVGDCVRVINESLLTTGKDGIVRDCIVEDCTLSEKIRVSFDNGWHGYYNPKDLELIK